MTLFLTYSSSLTCSAAQPPHRLSSFDDPYHPTVSAAASPRASVASFAPSHSPSSGSYVRVEHDDAMPLSTGQHSGYANMDAPYSNQEYSSSRWLEKEQARSRRSKWIVSFISFPLYTAYRIASPSRAAARPPCRLA